MELVSIIITTHNRSDVIGRAIESAINQTYNNIEVIIVDDHSTDKTNLIVDEYLHKHNNLFYHQLPNNITGACAARNMGINLAKGKYIAGLDDDDEFDIKRIEILMKYIKDEYVFVCSSSKYSINGCLNKQPFRFSNSIKEINRKHMLWHNVVGNQILVKKDDIVSISEFDNEMPCNQDWDTWLRLLAFKNRALYIPDNLQIVYVNKGRSSITKNANRRLGLMKLFKKNSHDMSFWQKHFFYFREYRFGLRKLSLLMIISCIPFLFYRIRNFK